MDRAKVIEIPPLNPPQVRSSNVRFVIFSFSRIANDGMNTEKYLVRMLTTISSNETKIIVGRALISKSSSPIKTKSVAFRVSSISSQNLSTYSAVMSLMPKFFPWLPVIIPAATIANGPDT